jgi:hypothetical protein
MRRSFGPLLAGVAGLAFATTLHAQARTVPTRPARVDAAVSSLFSPASDAQLPELMVGPSLTLRVAEALGGVVSLEGAVRFRADGNQTIICPQPPGVVCDARSARSVASAVLSFAKGFGAQPLVRGPLVRVGVGGAFASLEGTARRWPAENGAIPTPSTLERNVGMAEVGLGWLQPMGGTSVRLEGRVNAFTPSLAQTRQGFSLVLGVGY